MEQGLQSPNVGHAITPEIAATMQESFQKPIEDETSRLTKSYVDAAGLGSVEGHPLDNDDVRLARDIVLESEPQREVSTEDVRTADREIAKLQNKISNPLLTRNERSDLEGQVREWQEIKEDASHGHRGLSTKAHEDHQDNVEAFRSLLDEAARQHVDEHLTKGDFWKIPGKNSPTLTSVGTTKPKPEPPKGPTKGPDNAVKAKQAKREETRDRVLKNLDESRKAREASKFGKEPKRQVSFAKEFEQEEAEREERERLADLMHSGGSPTMSRSVLDEIHRDEEEPQELGLRELVDNFKKRAELVKGKATSGDRDALTDDYLKIIKTAWEENGRDWEKMSDLSMELQAIKNDVGPIVGEGPETPFESIEPVVDEEPVVVRGPEPVVVDVVLATINELRDAVEDFKNHRGSLTAERLEQLRAQALRAVDARAAAEGHDPEVLERMRNAINRQADSAFDAAEHLVTPENPTELMRNFARAIAALGPNSLTVDEVNQLRVAGRDIWQKAQVAGLPEEQLNYIYDKLDGELGHLVATLPEGTSRLVEGTLDLKPFDPDFYENNFSNAVWELVGNDDPDTSTRIYTLRNELLESASNSGASQYELQMLAGEFDQSIITAYREGTFSPVPIFTERYPDVPAELKERGVIWGQDYTHLKDAVEQLAAWASNRNLSEIKGQDKLDFKEQLEALEAEAGRLQKWIFEEYTSKNKDKLIRNVSLRNKYLKNLDEVMTPVHLYLNSRVFEEEKTSKKGDEPKNMRRFRDRRTLRDERRTQERVRGRGSSETSREEGSERIKRAARRSAAIGGTALGGLTSAGLLTNFLR